MAYSEIKVVAGGLAHIPIIIGFFWFIQNKVFGNSSETNDESKNSQKKSIPKKSADTKVKSPIPAKATNTSEKKSTK
tara:strand:- start:118 stop:348 length:231 start_codon:yes stop_codon:yes gene_type:complete